MYCEILGPSSRQALTHALYDLATHPQYTEALREEVEAVISTEGWTKVAMGKMWKLDSVLKESQRMAIGARKALFYPRKILRGLFLLQSHRYADSPKRFHLLQRHHSPCRNIYRRGHTRNAFRRCLLFYMPRLVA